MCKKDWHVSRNTASYGKPSGRLCATQSSKKRYQSRYVSDVPFPSWKGADARAVSSRDRPWVRARNPAKAGCYGSTNRKTLDIAPIVVQPEMRSSPLDTATSAHYTRRR